MSSAPVDIGREDARRAAAEELSDARYEDESLLERLWRWVEDVLTRLLAEAAALGVDGTVALGVLVVVLGGLAAVLVWSLRRVSRRARVTSGEVLGRQGRTAAEHRAAAERFASLGDWPAAIQERMRAVARTLEAREVVTDLPSRTAVELAIAAGAALPMLSIRLAAAARLFDAVTYGEHAGSREDYAALSELDHDVGSADAMVPVP
jgi:Domain of unknown function (DUF4129)